MWQQLASILGGSVFSGIAEVVKSLKVDPTTALQLEYAIKQAQLEFDAKMSLAQNAVNAEEAKTGNLFIAGWRPFVGWVCGSAMAYKFLVLPFLLFALQLFHVQFDVKQLPVLDWAEMSTVLMGMLGLGAMRTYEKQIGVTK